uniref:Uncharacterized protein n=1 Tax=Lepeophtheirus salmonis TaxID=72036 RepID=A0A0K2TMW2_LEPSM
MKNNVYYKLFHIAYGEIQVYVHQYALSAINWRVRFLVPCPCIETPLDELKKGISVTYSL